MLVDNKAFDAALADYEEALRLAGGGDQATVARLLAGRALTYEGLSDWQRALDDYEAAIACVRGARPRPPSHSRRR